MQSVKDQAYVPKLFIIETSHGRRVLSRHQVDQLRPSGTLGVDARRVRMLSEENGCVLELTAATSC